MLQPVQCALARQGRGLIPGALELAQKHAQDRIAAQIVVVVEVLIAERQAEHALPNQSLQRVDGEKPAATVGKARGEPFGQPDRVVRLAKQQSPRVRGDQTAVEIRHHTPPAGASKLHLCRATPPRHRDPLRIGITR